LLGTESRDQPPPSIHFVISFTFENFNNFLLNKERMAQTLLWLGCASPRGPVGEWTYGEKQAGPRLT
jgi:hypothetical protein